MVHRSRRTSKIISNELIIINTICVLISELNNEHEGAQIMIIEMNKSIVLLYSLSK